MSPGTYSLATTVSFLEAMLRAVGHEPDAGASLETRESLRERFRTAVRLFKRFRAHQDANSQSWSFTSMLCVAEPGHWFGQQSLPAESDGRENEHLFGTRARPVRESQVDVWADTHVLRRSYGGAGNADFARSSSAIAMAPPTIFDVAMRVAVDGITCVYAAVMNLWSRRHDLVSSPASDKRRPKRRRALERLFLALMRFAFGFFGSHKVDARNNP